MAEQYIQGEIALLKKGGYHRSVIFWEDDNVTRKNTTGYTLFVELSQRGTVIDTWSIANGQIEHTPLQGQFNIRLTDEQVLAYKFAKADYRMWVDYGDDYPQVLEIGIARVK